jgi:hypothetical protein
MISLLDKIQDTEEIGCNMSTECPVTDTDNTNELQLYWQKQPGETIKQTSRCVRPKLVNRWPSSI